MFVAYIAKSHSNYQVCEDYNGVVLKILCDEWVNPMNSEHTEPGGSSPTSAYIHAANAGERSQKIETQNHLWLSFQRSPVSCEE